MSILKKGFNMFAEGGTALNRMINQAIGKDVFKDIKKIEEPREFPPYDAIRLSRNILLHWSKSSDRLMK